MAFSSIVLDILGVCNENTIFVTPLFKKKSFVTTGVEGRRLWNVSNYEKLDIYLKDIFEYIRRF